MVGDSGGDGEHYDQAGGRAEARVGGTRTLMEGTGKLQPPTPRRATPDRGTEKEKGTEMLKTMIEGRLINFMGALLPLIEGGATEILLSKSSKFGRNPIVGIVPAFRFHRFFSKVDFASTKFMATRATRRGDVRPILRSIRSCA